MAIHRAQQENIVDSFSPAEEEDFGAFIERIRRRSRIQIQEVAAQFPQYLKEWDRFTYSHLVGERKRAPRFEELLPLYQALVIAGVHFNATERNQFLALARLKIERKPQRKDVAYPSEQQWRALHAAFAAFDGLPLTPELEQVLPRSASPSLTRLSRLEEDRRHLVGRNDWVREMQAHVSADPPKKLVVIQAALGAGKSSALHLFRRSLEEQGDYRVFFFTCASPRNMTAEEHLDRFLADLFAFFGIQGQQGENDQPTPTQRTQLLLRHLAQMNKQVVLFIDNVEVVLQEHGQLAVCWQQLFTDFVQYQHRATLFFATREWPGWAGRNRTYIVLNKLPPLSPEAGAAIWRRMGFDDVAELLLQQVSTRCGSNPWMIELRASTLQDMPLDVEDDVPLAQEDTQENAHTQLIKHLLRKPRMFGSEADRETKRMLQEVLSMHLSPHALLLLDILACSPLALPLATLKGDIPQVEEAFEELQHASLVDLDTKIYAQRAQLLPVVSEAVLLHRLAAQERRGSIEEAVQQVYLQWLKQGIQSDHEKSAVVAELIVFALTHLRLLEAAERLLQYGWLLARFGHTTRIARLAYHVLENELWRSTAEQECGGLLLRHHLAPFLGQKSAAEVRVPAYQRIYTALLQQQVRLQVPTELYVVHQLMAAHRDALRFHEAEALLNQAFERHPEMEQTHPHRFASLLGRRAALLGTWSEYADEQKQHEQAQALREQAITAYRQCISLWEQCEAQELATKRSSYTYRRARHLNDLGYYLRKQGKFDEALACIEQSLTLKNAGYVEPGSLATSYGEKAQCLAALGRFQQALHFDQLAVENIQQEAASSGNSLLQEDVWVHLVERGELYLCLGRLKEAEPLFQQASTNISDDRRSHRTLARSGLVEIRRWRELSPNEQLDWRWAARYREIVRYDPFKWLTPASFSPGEYEEWARLQEQEPGEDSQHCMEDLITQSRDREIFAALGEDREPRFQYPLIPIDEVKSKLEQLSRLAADIDSSDAEVREPNAIVRRLYLDVIDEHLCYLRMIQATHEGDSQAFWRYNRAIHAEPTPEEMERALFHVARFIDLGRRRADTVEVSERVYQLLRNIRAHLPVVPAASQPVTSQQTTPSSLAKPRMIAPQTVKRFFDAVMRDYGFDGWTTSIDSTANDPRIEQLTQDLILPNKSLSVASVRSLLSHEIESHVFRAAAGAKSRLDLLATGTRGFMATEEGLALYYDRKTAQLQGKVVEEFSAGSLFGTLATGLASGVVTTTLTFSQLYQFLEQFLILYRTVTGVDKDVQKARAKAPNLARQRCLRTFRGVPDLTVPGVAYLKDGLYYRGQQQVTAAIQQDPQKLTRLMVGVVGIEQLDDLAELGITEPPYRPQWLAHDPGLAEYMLSFEVASDGSLV